MHVRMRSRLQYRLLTLCPAASSGPQGLYTAYIQPIYSLYAAYIQPIYRLYAAYIGVRATLSPTDPARVCTRGSELLLRERERDKTQTDTDRHRQVQTDTDTYRHTGRLRLLPCGRRLLLPPLLTLCVTSMCVRERVCACVRVCVCVRV